MVYRKIPQPFGIRTLKKRSKRWIVNELPKTFNDQIYPRLPFLIRSRHYKIKSKIDNNPDGQQFNLTFKLSDLFRDERIVLNYNKAVQLRPYAERLIVEAMRNGDRHRPTMALANYWLREKNLVHKLFKVFVPRYENYPSAFTAIHMLGKNYEEYGLPHAEILKGKGPKFKMGEAVIEMRGNNLPPITRPKLDRSGLLTNILIDGARESRLQKIAAAAAAARTTLDSGTNEK